MVAPLVIGAAGAAGGAAAGAGAAGAAGMAGAAAGAGAAGAGAAGAASAGGAASAAGAEGATAARANLLAERHAARQAATGGPNLPSSAPANAELQQAEGSLNQSGQWRAQEQRLKVARERVQSNTLDIDENELLNNTLDRIQSVDANENDEETVEQPPREDPVTRLYRGAERAVVQAADNDFVAQRASDTVTATIQGTGFTSLTLVDGLLGLLLAFPFTIIQFLITFRIIQQPSPGTKMKLLYDWMDYHVWSATGLFKLQGGIFILIMGLVSFTLLLALFSIMFIPILMATGTLGGLPTAGSGAANQAQQELRQ